MKSYLILAILMYSLTLPSERVNTAYRFLFQEPYRSISTQILYGGAGSGKSVAVAQRDIFDIVNEPRNFLIVRNTANTLRGSVFEERRKVINQWGLRKFFDIKESNLQIVYKPTGNIMLFCGLDDVEKLKSITVPNGPITDLRIEEATECREETFEQLELRMRGITTVPKRVVLSFNPVFRRHWISKRFFNGRNIKFAYNDDVLIFKTTYKDNDFITAQDKAKIESKKGYYHQVYALGNWGVLGDLIYNNWEIESCANNNYDKTLYGLDFGFASDPAALIKVGVHRPSKTLYMQQELYIHGATNDVLAAKAKPIVNNSIVWCDSAEPKSIQELRNMGENRLHAQAVSKGKDSKWHGIQWLQQWNIKIDKNCVNFIDEISQYQWKKNKDGETLPEPIDNNDHLLDATRYATEQERRPQGSMSHISS